MTQPRSGDENTTVQGDSTPSGERRREPSQQPQEDEPTGWLANVVVRIGLALVGFVLFLFALGQAVGFDLLELFVEAVSSQTGRWLVVALFALLLIALAQRGIRDTVLGR